MAFPPLSYAQCEKVVIEEVKSPFSNKIGVLFSRSCNGGKASFHIAVIDNGEKMPEIGNVAIVNAPQNMSTLDWDQIYGKEVFFVHTFKGYDYTLMKKTIKGIQVRYSS